jgi:hypothetical protein
MIASIIKALIKYWNKLKIGILKYWRVLMWKPEILDANRGYFVNYKSYYRLADKYFELSDIIIQTLDERKIHSTKFTEYQQILGFSFYKCISSFVSVFRLCDAVCVGDAMSICRKLIEIVLNMQYISLHPDKYAIMYKSHGAIRARAELKQNQEESKKGASKIYNDKFLEYIGDLPLKVEAEYQKALKVFANNEKGKPLGKFARNWSGKNQYDMAKDCDMEIDYLLYGVFSSKIHASIADEGAFYDNEKYIFKFDRELKDIPWVLIETLRMFSEICAMVISSFDLKLQDSLELLMQELFDLTKKYKFVPR